MIEVLRLNGTEVSISTANTVANASLIRVFNANTTTPQVLTIANTGGTISNTTISFNREIYVRKNPTDTAQGTNLLAVPVKSI